MRFFLTILIITFGTIFSNLAAQNRALAKEYQKELESAYKKNSDSLLEKFLTKWSNDLKPNFPDNSFANDTIKNVYEIYTEFYKPFDLLKLGNWEWENELNSKSKFALVQNKLYYSIVSLDSLNESKSKYESEIKKEQIIKKDSIIDFRPKLSFENHNILYLTPEYKTALNKFLGTQSTKFGKPNIMSVSRPKKESEKRHKFIRPYLPVLHGHWGGYWNIETSPTIYGFYLNKNLNQAKILFVVGYQGGESFLEKENGKWVIKESKTTWIE